MARQTLQSCNLPLRSSFHSFSVFCCNLEKPIRIRRLHMTARHARKVCLSQIQLLSLLSTKELRHHVSLKEILQRVGTIDCSPRMARGQVCSPWAGDIAARRPQRGRDCIPKATTWAILQPEVTRFQHDQHGNTATRRC